MNLSNPAGFPVSNKVTNSLNISINKAPRLGTFSFDAILSAKTKGSQRLTKIPLESGAEVNDHRIKEPDIYVMEGAVSNFQLRNNIDDLIVGSAGTLSAINRASEYSSIVSGKTSYNPVDEDGNPVRDPYSKKHSKQTEKALSKYNRERNEAAGRQAQSILNSETSFLNGIMSAGGNVAAGYLSGGDSGLRSHAVIELLFGLKETGALITVSTGIKVMSDMIISDIMIDEDANTGGGFIFRLELTQYMFVKGLNSVSVDNMDASVAKMASPKSILGEIGIEPILNQPWAKDAIKQIDEWLGEDGSVLDPMERNTPQ